MFKFPPFGNQIVSLYNNGFLDNLYQSPPFVFGQRTGLHNPDRIADLGFIVLIVSLEFFGVLDSFVIQAMFLVGFYGDNYRFVHFVANDFADLLFTLIAFSH
jgi:hypothetical protein